MRILVADDNAAVRGAIARLISGEDIGEVCGEAADGPMTLEKARELDPELVLLDISMPGSSGLDTARQLRKEHPQLKIVLVTQNDPTQLLPAVRAAGADGCIDKSRLPTDLAESVRILFPSAPGGSK
jgi:DNA-binding NarL/FixJ family response regulator